MESNLSIGIAFFAGLASFLSPCVFALVPAYVGYLSGRSAGVKDEDVSSWRTLSHGIAFVLGFTVVFVSLGALAGLIGGMLNMIMEWLVIVGGVVVFIFGLHMLRIIRVPFLDYDLRKQGAPESKGGYLSSALMGVFFSAGWSPCVGPILGAILTLVLNGGSPLEGALLLTAYSAGLGIPFLLAATQIGWVTTVLRRFNKVMHYTEITMGVLLLVIGFLLVSGKFQTIAIIASSQGFFFESIDEVLLGRLLLIGVSTAFAVGLIPGAVARQFGKRFVDYWFLGAGVSLILLIVLFVLGAFNSLLPALS
ncbi:MAG: cytochrome c biogenesis protein CcdA [Anaerolineae bacterium]|nr:cytochrome c biogenesis protein CcdA [Anaerolineae bacterium]